LQDEDIELREAWAGFLGKLGPWDAFATITFREARMPWHALSTVNQARKLLTRVGACNGFLGTELHKSRALHLHGVLRWDPHMETVISLPSRAWRACYDSFGRTKIDGSLTSAEAVNMYVSKYVTKEMGEWILW